MKLVLAVSMVVIMSGCQKFLDVKPDQRLTVPSSLKDLQALLDDYSTFASVPNAGEISSGDFYLTDADLSSLQSDSHRRMYRWENDHLFEERSYDWNAMLAIPVYHSNTVLNSIEKIGRTTQNRIIHDNVKGSAKYYRARTWFHASLIWTQVYNEGTANNVLGLPLRTTVDFNEPSERASLKETYDLLIKDLKEAAALLPELPIHVVRPSKAAAYGLLARVYLYVGDYEQAFFYSDSCLQIKNTLMDYNELDGSVAFPIPQYNEEIIQYYGMAASQVLNTARAKVKPEIIAMYEAMDLRKTLFFLPHTDGAFGFKGRYTGTASLFGGMATDEMYLIRAECSARVGDLQAAIEDLNVLLATRYLKENGTSTYKPTTTMQEDEVLKWILDERRKQLLFRGLRWYDIKRLNREGANIELIRKIGDELLRLAPNDLRYALPFPEDVITMSGMTQNPR